MDMTACGARGGSRTRTEFPPPDPKSGASAISPLSLYVWRNSSEKNE